jgi:hypothetical protein
MSTLASSSPETDLSSTDTTPLEGPGTSSEASRVANAQKIWVFLPFYFRCKPSKLLIHSLPSQGHSSSEPITFNAAALRNGRSSHPKEQVYSELTSKQHYKLLHPKDADHHYHFEQLRAHRLRLEIRHSTK